MWHKASAPGSLMLLGEYAVLHGKSALVAAVDKRVTIHLRPRTDQKIFITSVLGRFSCDLSHLTVAAPFQFVLMAIQQFSPKPRIGFELDIESDFLHTQGLGSSAAVTVATITVLAAWLNQSMTPDQVIQQARAVIQAVQGEGSGADVAASVLGGIVTYRAGPLFAEKLHESIPLTVIYSGHKTPTGEAISQVNQAFLNKPQRFQHICNEIDSCTAKCLIYITQKNWRALGQVMNVQQRWMEELGVNTPALTSIIATLRAQPSILGAKISGAGFGDCVIGLGMLDKPLIFNDPKIKLLSVKLSSTGVICEKE
jgi:mevalonate kinase